MRSLLFFQEKKQKKIAKIKSKAYRKIHKKDKQKEDLSLEELKALDPELARAEMEKLDAQRAMVRLTCHVLNKPASNSTISFYRNASR